MKALIYTRVSSEDQTKGSSLAKQKTWAIKECKKRKNDFSLFEEPGVSGENIFGRKQLTEMLAQIEEGQNDKSILFVWDSDRLTRSTKDWFGTIQPLLVAHEITVITSQGTINLNSRDGRLTAGIKTVVDADEKERIRERCQAGLNASINQGFHAGVLPTGLKYDSTDYVLTLSGRKRAKIVPDNDKADMVKQVFELAQNYTQGQISALMAKDYPKIISWKITRILRRPIYAGVVRDKNGQLISCAQIDKPLISFALYEKVNSRLRCGHTTRGAPGQYILSGLLECGYCRWKMYYIRNWSARSKRKGRSAYEGYRCSSKYQDKNSCKQSRSHSRFLLESLVESAIKRKITMANEADLKADINKFINQDKRISIVQLKKELGKLEKSKNHLLDVAEAAELPVKEISERLAKANNRMAVIRTTIESSKIPDLDADSIIQILYDLPNVVDDKKRELYLQVIEKIVVYRDRIQIIWTCLKPTLIYVK